MSSNWYHQYKSSKEEELTSNNPPIRFHPYERNEEEQHERRVKFATIPATTTSSNSLVGAIKENMETLGGVIPRAGCGRDILKRVDSVWNDSFVLNGNTPATGAYDALQRRANRGSHNGDVSASPARKTTAATQLTLPSARVGDQDYQLPLASARVEGDQAYQLPLASARIEGDQVYQLWPIRPTVSASPARKTTAATQLTLPSARVGDQAYQLPLASARVEGDQAYQLPLASARIEGDQVYQLWPIRPTVSASPARKTTAATQLTLPSARIGDQAYQLPLASARVEGDQAYQLPLASARVEGDQVYQPWPIRPIANSLVAAAPAYTVELVSVAPGVQIQKKKFLPRYLPMPVGTPPGGLGRPILGRGSLLYSLRPQPDLPSALAQGRNVNESLLAEAPAQSLSADVDLSNSPVGPVEYHPLRAELRKSPFSQ